MQLIPHDLEIYHVSIKTLVSSNFQASIISLNFFHFYPAYNHQTSNIFFFHVFQSFLLTRDNIDFTFVSTSCEHIWQNSCHQILIVFLTD